MSQLTVSKEFVQEAHKAACEGWKKRIEKEFPDLWPSLPVKIHDLPEYKDLHDFLTIKRDIVEITEDEKFIRVKLPNANSSWTFKAWKLAEAIYHATGYYPQHGYDTDKTHITLKKMAV